ncbi:MAG: DNA-directed RNA polymerase subunit beta' [Planctomycetes bacterium]|nr:DNA-directed RNA polymerase subunit beta' [Planctomycetota bacterium]
MADMVWDRINDFGSVSISLASPEDIRSWSYGEVKKPETINYRTYRSERDGLFCEKIFGPERDYECFCGKFKGIKHKGKICDRCGVKITTSRVRRKRMGHINLAAPVAHIWFFKAMPSRMGALLGVKTSSLERVIYYQDYIVIDSGSVPDLKNQELLTDDVYKRLKHQYGDTFEAGKGAEAIKKILSSYDLDKLAIDLRTDLKKTKSKQKIKDLIKRIQVVESLQKSGNKPEWMILDVIPVIPPDLRPLVMLDSGHFATSDLNDLYRRLINRNNRLKKLLELNAPEVIIRNEKRMLQQSVDALFDNARCRRSVLGTANRPLKSLTDMIKGKQGRFRENLLGKRVDYSGRSVIAVGPELKLHQCGIPKKIALELYQPFIIRRLKEENKAETIKTAKKMLERKDEQVWDILEEVIHDHPVMLNRAPTLHRIGIQAFEPVLIEGNAIKIHPLVCAGFNADFDGDQMAVHLPLSWEAQIEAWTLLLSTNNIFSPAHGGPVIAPSQDIVLGCYYLTVDPYVKNEGKLKVFADRNEVFLAYSHGKVKIHDEIIVKLAKNRLAKDGPDKEYSPEKGRLRTTPGRVIFNDILPPEMPYYNYKMSKRAINGLIADCHQVTRRSRTLQLLDDLKDLGFKAATLAGISFSKSDLLVPPDKAEILASTQGEVDEINSLHTQGLTTDSERYNEIIQKWTHAREILGESVMKTLKSDPRGINPVWIMADSGARGSIDQIRQLAGMRGLMAKPNGKIIETPIRANFREGLTTLEYFSSTHGARKGLADTALKTADSGYLTRKLADIGQNVIISMDDCRTNIGIRKTAEVKGEKTAVPLWKNIRGRTICEKLIDRKTGVTICEIDDTLTEDQSKQIEECGYEVVIVRSVLTCEAPFGVCQKCYGWDLSRGKIVELGLAVGIVAAQSIGEPGTQLTMRTFHYGGTATAAVASPSAQVMKAGKVKFEGIEIGKNRKGKPVSLTRNGEILIVDNDDRELERHQIPVGAVFEVQEGDKVPARKVIAKWDQNNRPILAKETGVARFEDIIEGETLKVEIVEGGKHRRSIMEHKGQLHPQILIVSKKNEEETLGVYTIPEGALITVEEGEEVWTGVELARTPRDVGGVQDITGGLPRVTELFEARRPKNPAVISEIDGVVQIGEKKRGKIILTIRSESGVEREHQIPIGSHFRVGTGDRVKAGEPLIEGSLIPHDILRINGTEALFRYLIGEVQNVYRSQSVTIDDKHIETIIAQMLRKVKILEPNDTNLLPEQVIDKIRLMRVNKETEADGGKKASAVPQLLGITKGSLQSESFISAASFQETTKVLTEASIAGRKDDLLGLKENVILGHMIPAGTGFRKYSNGKLAKYPGIGTGYKVEDSDSEGAA